MVLVVQIGVFFVLIFALHLEDWSLYRGVVDYHPGYRPFVLHRKYNSPSRETCVDISAQGMACCQNTVRDRVRRPIRVDGLKDDERLNTQSYLQDRAKGLAPRGLRGDHCPLRISRGAPLRRATHHQGHTGASAHLMGALQRRRQ